MALPQITFVLAQNHNLFFITLTSPSTIVGVIPSRQEKRGGNIISANYALIWETLIMLCLMIFPMRFLSPPLLQ